MDAIKEITNRSEYKFIVNDSNSQYFPATQQKEYVIHMLNSSQKPIESFKDFCSHHCADDWDGIDYYINQTVFYGFFPERKRSDFERESEYKEYKDNMIILNHTRSEQVLDIGNGKVLEYRLYAAEIDTLGNFYGTIVPYQLIYKVPCSRDLSVFITPKPGTYTVEPSGSFADIINNWIIEDERLREDIFEVANQILELCPVEDSFFEGTANPYYYFSEILTGFWKIYQREFLGIDQSLQLDVRKKDRGEGYYLENLNYSMKIKDDDLTSIYADLTIKTSVDGKREMWYYEREKPLDHSEFDIELKKRKKVEFSDSLTVTVYLTEPGGGFEIRKYEVTYTKDDFDHLEE